MTDRDAATPEKPGGVGVRVLEGDHISCNDNGQGQRIRLLPALLTWTSSPPAVILPHHTPPHEGDPKARPPAPTPTWATSPWRGRCADASKPPSNQHALEFGRC